MEAEPSWSALEAWQVEQPAAFFCLDTGSPLTSKLEHADSKHCDLWHSSFPSFPLLAQQGGESPAP